ncbi:hypothetical protein GCM10010977_24370 [Citricoccus zhacaiensis]|uniref:Uncharacterized protein n=1 Tax=Citricoccus zhacaiensis TaxID=489142 RepID=A0ABQ2M664_9MICC|nr:hypothetical protein GCM10010977_24370 [Citricoccus zhacaiensis]
MALADPGGGDHLAADGGTGGDSESGGKAETHEFQRCRSHGATVVTSAPEYTGSLRLHRGRGPGSGGVRRIPGRLSSDLVVRGTVSRREIL